MINQHLHNIHHASYRLLPHRRPGQNLLPATPRPLVRRRNGLGHPLRLHARHRRFLQPPVPQARPKIEHAVCDRAARWGGATDTAEEQLEGAQGVE